MELMDGFEKAKQSLYDHVGFMEDWVVYAIDDRTEMFWRTDPEERLSVKYAETMEKFNSCGDYYKDEIYTQRFYPKWVYRGEKLTMIFVDTHTDGNKFFAFYYNEKEVNNP